MKLNTDRNRLHEAVVFAVCDAAEALIAARMAVPSVPAAYAEKAAMQTERAVRDLAVSVLKASGVTDAEIKLAVAVDALYERRKAKRGLAEAERFSRTFGGKWNPAAVSYLCARCGKRSPIVNGCGCDPNNLPTTTGA